MPSAAMSRLGLSSLTGLVVFGWAVVATAQAAPAPAAPSNAEKAPAAKPKAATAPTAPKATPTAPPPTTATPTTATPTAAAPNAKSAAPPPAGPATAPATGETWGKPTTDSTAPTPGNQAPGGPNSPWPERNVSGDGNAPPVYYVEAAPSPEAGPKSAPPAHAGTNAGPNAGNNTGEDLEPMHLAIDEPPPPPVPRHTAPRTALWLGARLGYFIPFGDLWGRCSSNGYSACDQIDGTKFSDVAATGPMVELDLGMRLGRNYMLYLGWERAQLGSSDGSAPDGGYGIRQRRAESDFVGVGFRLSANPDDVGLLLDLAIGARRFRAFYEGDVELQLSEAPMESRLGIGADIRINRKFALSPMLTLGLGSFGKADWVTRDSVVSAIPGGSDRLTHGWLTLQLGGHFDLAASQ